MDLRTLAALVAPLAPAPAPAVPGGSAAPPSVWYVDDDASAPGNGTAREPFASLQYAIEHPSVLPGDRILVSPGVYERIDFSGKSLVVSSTDGPEATVLDGELAGSVVTLASGESAATVLEGFTVTGGYGTEHDGRLVGAGIFCSGSSPRIRDCIVRDNRRFVPGWLGSAVVGAGLYAESGTVVVRGCEFRHNGSFLDAISGSAIHAEDASLVVADSTIHMNEARGAALTLIGCTARITASQVRANASTEQDGAGMRLEGSEVAITGSVLEGNTAVAGERRSGGGISVQGGELGLADTVLRGNFADNGGAIHATRDAVVRVERSSFEGNTAVAFDLPAGAVSGCGGALFLDPSARATVSGSVFAGNRARRDAALHEPRGGAVHGAAALVRCTLVDNSADIEGGAVFGATTLEGSIAWGNLPDQLAGGALARYSDVQGGAPGEGNLDADPRFWDSGGLDVHLMAGSPCIDAGNPAAPPDPDGTVADAGARPFDADHCGTPRALCTPKVNSRGCIPEIGFEGAPVLGAQGELDFVVSASNVLNNQIGILVWSPTPAAVPFLGGVRCVGTPFVRSPVLATGGNPPPLDCSGRLRFRFTAEYVADAGLRPFETVYAQFWYRDPGFAPPEDVGLTDALRFVLCP